MLLPLASDPLKEVQPIILPERHQQNPPCHAQGAKAGLKEAALLALASDPFKAGQAIIFFSTKQAAHRARLQFGLAQLPPAAELHGNLTQAQRLEALEAFRQVLQLPNTSANGFVGTSRPESACAQGHRAVKGFFCRVCRGGSAWMAACARSPWSCPR